MTTTNRSDEGAGTDLVDRIAIAYLALPLLVFFLGWFETVPAAILIFAMLFGMVQLMRGPLAPAGIGVRWVLAAGLLACVWAAFGGAGHLLYANEYDWRIRDAVLRDLVVAPWPVAYGEGPVAELVLRAPLAYFLPPALLAKALGIAYADLLLFVWTTGGVALFMVLGMRALSSTWARIIWLVALPWFSGMDALAWWWFKAHPFTAGQHIEWWATLYQYSSNSTLLFWVPNHALAGWIAAALLVKHWNRPIALLLFAFLFAATVLWSPLVTIGLLPFLVAWLGLHWHTHRTWMNLVTVRAVAVAVSMALVFAAVGKWTTADVASMSSGSTIAPIAMHASIEIWLVFSALEWGVLAALVYVAGWRHPAFWPTCATLLVLPLIRFGITNDLAMRASIIPLAVLTLGAAQILADSWERRKLWPLAAIGTVLLVGAMTPLQEIYRAATQPTWSADLDSNLQQVARSKRPPNYIARWESMPPYLRLILRAPTGLAPAGRVLDKPRDRRMP